ncbi:hypothetical protein QO207_30655 [Pseudomonas sp. CAN2814]|uniref:hypothetical protein n=1 Tax=Pseudomonas sp. CAN1 TaxID=3046726 RepID=UPI002647699D|nr:hypothetical protein [Pseudomonas sp. CAN1]MDN6860975.1 hypothetical protein [Pseudomonas sp. CAN1]
MDTRSKRRRANSLQISLMGAGLMLLALVLAITLVNLWPQTYPQFPRPGEVGDAGVQCLLGWCPGPDARLLVMVMVAGALGSFVHVAKSFGDFVGNDRFMASWIWWYLLKPCIGMALALMVYLIVRAVLLTLNPASDAASVNLYGLMAMAALVGMASKQGTDKFADVLDALFRTRRSRGDARRKDQLENPVAVISEAQPPLLDAQSLYVTLRGVGFSRGARVQVNGVERETSLADSSRLAFHLLPEDVAVAGSLAVVVVNPAPGGGPSAPLMLEVSAPPEPEAEPEPALAGRVAMVVASAEEDSAVASLH